ncbi:MAG: response regulator [Allorhizobium sp.]
MSQKLRVAVVDDHPLFRDGVTRTLKELGFDVVGEGECAEDAIAIAEQKEPDLLLLDISMPGDGLLSIERILSCNEGVKIVMLTASEDGDHVRRSLQAGARGYVLKGTDATGLAEILRSVAGDERYVPPGLSAKLIVEALSPPSANEKTGLSSRELEVVDLVATGSSNKVIARKLGLHEKTVKRHMTSILAKLRVSNRTEAALKWQSAHKHQSTND